MAPEQGVFAWTNRNGATYYLHRRVDGRGKDRFVFAREIGEGPLAAVPDGYEVRESVNGAVSLARTVPRLIQEGEERMVVQALRAKPFHQVEVKKNTIVVLEGPPIVHLPGLLTTKSGRYSEVLKFTLVDRDQRTFEVARMTYRGNGGWSYPLGHGPLADLIRGTVPHLGKDSFFDLH